MKNYYLPYVDGKFGKQAHELTTEKFEELVDSPQVAELMAKIEAEPDPEKQNAWKEQLPAVQYHCLWNEDGQRPKNSTAVASGLCMHDWDHLPESPRTLYQRLVEGHEEEIGLLLAHVTPRGEGLRLVTRLPEGETIEQCQHRVAKTFGMEAFADEHVKDLARLSFLPSRAYILYGQAPLPQPSTEKTSAEMTPIEKTPIEKVSDNEERPEVKADTQEAELYYNGLPYSQIIKALLARIATGGRPDVGERNTDLYVLTRELRHICNYNFGTLYTLVKPYFHTLSDQEIRRTISNAVDTAGRTITPMMKGVLDQLQKERDGFDSNELTLDKLPPVSPVMEMILKHFPKYLRPQVYLASLPIWGTYATHARFDYLDGRENTLSFMTSVVGKSGSGKSFANHLFKLMTPKLLAEDAMERQKADEYLTACTRAGDTGEKPDDPRPRVRIYGDDITTSQLLDYLDNLKGEHGLQFTEEVARLCKAKRTIYGDNDDLYCKSFDNAIGGKESKSKQTRNIRIPIYLNTLFCGTPGAMHKFYNNPEGGLNNRVIYAFMPNTRVRGIPRYTAFTPSESEQFEQTIQELRKMDAGSPKLQLPWLDSIIERVENKWVKEDNENPNEVWFDLGKRALVLAYRVGVLEWLLRGRPQQEKELKAIGRVVRWMADTVRASVYQFCGSEYEQINEADNALQQKAVRQTKNKQLFSLLPQEFSMQDVVNLRLQNGNSSGACYMVTKRWVDEGLVQRVSQGRFVKIKQVS